MYFKSLIITLLLISTNAFSIDPFSNDLVINIDNPNFRRFVIALPKFTREKGATSDLAKKIEKLSGEKLPKLINFSGLFNQMSESAYSDILKDLYNTNKAESSASWLKDYKGMSADDLSTWKNLGVEGVVLASIGQNRKNGTYIIIKIYDIAHGKEIKAKLISEIKNADFAIKKVADYILEAYTGKPGIFNSKLAFVARKTKKSAKQIYISDIDGTNIEQITQGNQIHISPTWGPKGRYLVYTSFEQRHMRLVLYDTVTKTHKKLTRRLGMNSGGNFAPNGKVLAYSASRGSDTEIFTISTQGTNRRLLISGSGLDVDPKFSPDGKYIAFVSGRYGNPHIFVGKLKWVGVTPQVISDQRLTYAGWYNSTPAWSPDSDRILFGGYDRDINRYDIFIMDPDGRNLERLTLKTGDNENPSWSPNGQMIVFQSNRQGNANIKTKPQVYFMMRDGSRQQKLPLPFYDVQTPTWSPQIQN